MEVDGSAPAPAADEVPPSEAEDDPMGLEGDVPPPPPPPPAGPADRRARVELPHPEEDHGPTYYRLGIDYDVNPDDEEIHIQCGRIKKLENLDRAGAKLKKLCLIANCVEKIEGLESCVNLEHLELYQNLLKRIDNIQHLTNLRVLDLSFNKIRACDALQACPFEHLERLYLSSNKIQDIDGIFHLTTLKMLELGSNRIRAIPQEIGSLVNLEELWLGKNKIVSMALPPLPALRHLSLQNNRLEAWEGSLFQNACGLTHFYVGHNNLPDLPPEFALLKDLMECDLVRNAITCIRPIPELTKLEELWLNDNQIDSLDQVNNLAAFPSLKTVYLERNPMHGLGDAAMEAAYKAKILEVVPHLVQLDAIRLQQEVKVITDGSEKKVIGIRKA